MKSARGALSHQKVEPRDVGRAHFCHHLNEALSFSATVHCGASNCAGAVLGDLGVFVTARPISLKYPIC